MEVAIRKKELLFVFSALLMIFAIPVMASHNYSEGMSITTDDDDAWTDAGQAENILFELNTTGDPLETINITVPGDASGYSNYTIDWSSLVLTHENWTCFNETDFRGNISKIICNTTEGNETSSINISFDAIAAIPQDSFHNWTIDTSDNNTGTNTTYMRTATGIAPNLYSPYPGDDTWTNGDFQSFTINITEKNLNTSAVFRKWTQNSGSWPDTSEYKDDMDCHEYTQDNYICNYTHDISGLSDEVDFFYYFYAYDNYTGYGNNGSESDNLVLHIDRVDPEMTVNSPENDTWHNKNISISADVSDSKSGVSHVWYNMSNSTWNQSNYMDHYSADQFNMTLDTNDYESGQYYKIKIFANDSVGNQINSSEIYVRFDNEVPNRTEIVYPYEGMVISGTIPVISTVSDSISGIGSVDVYRINETYDDDNHNSTWDEGENITGIEWTLQGSASGPSDPAQDNNWTFDWDVAMEQDGDYYLAINVTDNVETTPNYNQSASMDIAEANGMGKNSSGGMFVQVRNIGPQVNISTPPNTTQRFLEGFETITFQVAHIAGMNLSTFNLQIVNSTSSIYDIDEFNATQDCVFYSYDNDSYFGMNFTGYNCSTNWNTLMAGEGNTEMPDQTIDLKVTAESNKVNTTEMFMLPKSVTGLKNVTVNNTGYTPSVYLISPQNTYYSEEQSIDFKFYATDNDPTANMTCTLHVDGQLKDTDNAVYNGSTTVNWSTLSSGLITGTGTHHYRIGCTNQKGNEGVYSSSVVIDPNQIPYIILIPREDSIYSDGMFKSVGLYLNGTLNNNSHVYDGSVDRIHYEDEGTRATILYFNSSHFQTDDSLVSNIGAVDAEYISVVLAPEHVTPAMVRDLNGMLSRIDSDPYVDVSWGIMTAKDSGDLQDMIDRSVGNIYLNSTTNSNEYDPRSISTSRSSAFAPFEQAYTVTARVVSDLLGYAGTSQSYTGTDANANNIYLRYDNRDDSNIIYYAGGGTNTKLYHNTTDSNKISHDNNICPFYNPSDDTIGCSIDGSESEGTISSFKNSLLLYTTSDYFARISSNDTNPYEWDLDNGNSSQWVPDNSLILNMLNKSDSDGPISFIGSTSVSWITNEQNAKAFFMQLMDGNSVGTSLATAKNLLRLNINSTTDEMTKEYMTYMDNSLVLYGLPQIGSQKKESIIDYTESGMTQQTSQPSNGDPIAWTATLTISPSRTIGPIYDTGEWKESYGNIWYIDADEPAADVLDLSFVAALAGEYVPDPTAYDLHVSATTSSVDFTASSASISRQGMGQDSDYSYQTTSHTGTSQVSIDDFVYDIKNNDSLLFAIPYEPSGSIGASYEKTLSVSFKTDGISIQDISVDGSNQTNVNDPNNITRTFMLSNPSSLNVTGFTLRYPIPQASTKCSVSGDNLEGTCTVDSGYAVQDISVVSPGKHIYVLEYDVSSDMTGSLEVYYDGLEIPYSDIDTFNWGDEIKINRTLKTSTSTDADIYTEIVLMEAENPYMDVDEKSVVWYDKVQATIDSEGLNVAPSWNIPTNDSSSQPGKYIVKTYALIEGTEKYLLKHAENITITDRLSIDKFDMTNKSSNLIKGHLEAGKSNITFTVTVSKQTGKAVNGNLGEGQSLDLYYEDDLKKETNLNENGTLDLKLNNLDLEVGRRTMTVMVTDEANNTANETYEINVTNYIDTITVGLNDTAANEEDTIKVSGYAYGNDTSKVYNANVTVDIDSDRICNTRTDESGYYSCDWFVPYGKDEKNYNVEVSAYSPLNVSKVLDNSTNLEVIWLDVSIDPALKDLSVTSSSGFDKTVTVTGKVNYSEEPDNRTLIEDADIECFIEDDDGWNHTEETKVGELGNYTCTFDEGINHTGDYDVTVTATHNIPDDDPDYGEVRGHIVGSFSIIDISDDSGDSSGDSSSSNSGSVSISPPSTSDVETRSEVDIGYNKTITMIQGENRTISIYVTNRDDDAISNITLELHGASPISWSILGDPQSSSLGNNESIVFDILLEAPDDMNITEKEVSANIEGDSLDEIVSFTIIIEPSNDTMTRTIDSFRDDDQLIDDYSTRIKDLFDEYSSQGPIRSMLSSINSTALEDAKESLLEVESLIKESRALLEQGKSIEAFKAKRQAELIMEDINRTIEEQEKISARWSMMLTGLMIFAIVSVMIIVAVWYMMLPPKKEGYVPEDDFFQAEMRGGYLSRLANRLHNTVSSMRGSLSGKKKQSTISHNPDAYMELESLDKEFGKYLDDDEE